MPGIAPSLSLSLSRDILPSDRRPPLCGDAEDAEDVDAEAGERRFDADDFGVGGFEFEFGLVREDGVGVIVELLGYDIAVVDEEVEVEDGWYTFEAGEDPEPKGADDGALDAWYADAEPWSPVPAADDDGTTVGLTMGFAGRRWSGMARWDHGENERCG